MPSIQTKQRTPYVAALALLVLIWTVWLLSPHAHTSVPSVVGLMPQETTVPTVESPSEGTVLPAVSSVPQISDDGAAKSTPQAPAEGVRPGGGVAPGSGSGSGSKGAIAAKGDRPLILYAYSETPAARTNLKFFISHGLHANADFVFIMNGESNATLLIPKETNVNVIQRPNDCYDLGAYAEVLTAGDRWKAYKKFILLNASIRGPFLPYWAGTCWSDRYLSKVTDEVKLVGMTSNCWPQFHVQSMIWATDAEGMSLLLYPPQATPTEENPNPEPEVGINACFHTWDTAVRAEIGASSVIREAGFKLDVMMSKFHADREYIEHCDSTQNGDVLWNNAYGGTNVHPYETIFLKTNRDIDPKLMDRLTEWTGDANYTSYDYC